MNQAVDKIYGMEPIFRLRWRMEFSDHKPPIFSGWDSASTKQNEMAAYKNSSNLLYAVVEGENRKTWDLVRFAEMRGENFIQFKWIVAGKAPVFGLPDKDIKLCPRPMGMKIVGRDVTVIIYLSGQGRMVKTDPADRLGFVRAWTK